MNYILLYYVFIFVTPPPEYDLELSEKHVCVCDIVKIYIFKNNIL